MNDELELIIKKMNLKKNLIIECQGQLEQLQSQKDAMPDKVFKQQLTKFHKHFNKKLKEINKIKN